MRFLMVTTFYPPFNYGGDGTYVYRLSNELARRGHEVDVVHCADAYALQSPPPASAVVNHPRVTVHTLRSRAGVVSPLITQQTGLSGLKRTFLRALIEGGRFDVVHYHNMSLIGLDALTYGDAIKLYTTHEHWLVCPTHVLWRYNAAACERQTCFTCQIVSGRPPQWWRYTSLLSRAAAEVDQFLCPSRFTLAKHRELGFNGPMTHLPYFLPRSDDPVSDQSPHPRPYVLFVGRLEKIKGLQNAIRAFRTYRQCDLIVIGDGTYGQELKKAAAGLDHVHFLGRLPYERIRQWYRHAVVVVVPSICYEVFGIVLLEAFAVGTPALVTPFGALPEVIEESGGGLVYHDDEQLIRGVERLRLDPGLRRDLGERGRDAYLTRWTENPHIARYLAIVREVAEKKGRAFPAA